MNGNGNASQGVELRKKSSVAELLKNKFLVSPELLEFLENATQEEINHLVTSDEGALVLNNDSGNLMNRVEFGINWLELERSRVLAEKGHKPLAYSSLIKTLGSEAIQKAGTASSPHDSSPVRIVSSYTTLPNKREVSDFVNYYSVRFKAIQGILSGRPELNGLKQIGRLREGDSEKASIIGMIRNKQQTKNGHIVLEMEDLSGSVDVVVNKSRREVMSVAQDLVFDEVVGVSGSFRNGTFFASGIVLPDVPVREPKHSSSDGYAVFMSDLHFGSGLFLEDDFRKFLKWLNGGLGNAAQREIAAKVKYVLIAGDVVDGVGVYQDQFDELSVKDVRAQYQMCADFLSEIPGNIKIVISPGNHDAVRAAEPQSEFAGDFAEPLHKLPNLISVSNPAMVNIDSSDGFPGFDVLLYHGYSFDYYVANVDSIRKQGGYERADLIMKFLLQRRHLAPAHTSTLILPDPSIDPLFIGLVPDIFVTGHIHRTSVSEYRNVLLINSSCWQGKTKFQERLGHNPQPSRVPVLNLRTREARIINFGR